MRVLFGSALTARAVPASLFAVSHLWRRHAYDRPSKFHPAARRYAAMTLQIASAFAIDEMRPHAGQSRAKARPSSRRRRRGRSAERRNRRPVVCVRQAFRCLRLETPTRSGSRRSTQRNARTGRRQHGPLPAQPCRGTPRRRRIRATARWRYAASVADLRATGPARPGHRRCACRTCGLRVGISCWLTRPASTSSPPSSVRSTPAVSPCPLPAPDTNARPLPFDRRRRRGDRGAQHCGHRRLYEVDR